MPRVVLAPLIAVAVIATVTAVTVGLLRGRAAADALHWCDRARDAQVFRAGDAAGRVADGSVAVAPLGPDVDTGEASPREAKDSANRDAPSGSAGGIVVIGDSWSAGWRLADPTRSWPEELSGAVHVDGFPGSGFSEAASGCGAESFADRASAAIAGRHPSLVVVQGGLNDFDQSYAAVRDGFDRLLDRLAADRVVVVGPAPAPSRATGARRVDGWLAGLAAQRGVRYISSINESLPYLPDRLHLTAAGHAAYGRFVAAQLG